MITPTQQDQQQQQQLLPWYIHSYIIRILFDRKNKVSVSWKLTLGTVCWTYFKYVSRCFDSISIYTCLSLSDIYAHINSKYCVLKQIKVLGVSSLLAKDYNTVLTTGKEPEVNEATKLLAKYQETILKYIEELIVTESEVHSSEIQENIRECNISSSTALQVYEQDINKGIKYQDLYHDLMRSCSSLQSFQIIVQDFKSGDLPFIEQGIPVNQLKRFTTLNDGNFNVDTFIKMISNHRLGSNLIKLGIGRVSRSTSNVYMQIMGALKEFNIMKRLESLKVWTCKSDIIPYLVDVLLDQDSNQLTEFQLDSTMIPQHHANLITKYLQDEKSSKLNKLLLPLGYYSQELKKSIIYHHSNSKKRVWRSLKLPLDIFSKSLEGDDYQLQLNTFILKCTGVPYDNDNDNWLIHENPNVRHVISTFRQLDISFILPFLQSNNIISLRNIEQSLDMVKFIIQNNQSLQTIQFEQYNPTVTDEIIQYLSLNSLHHSLTTIELRYNDQDEDVPNQIGSYRLLEGDRYPELIYLLVK